MDAPLDFEFEDPLLNSPVIVKKRSVSPPKSLILFCFCTTTLVGKFDLGINQFSFLVLLFLSIDVGYVIIVYCLES